MYNLFGKKANQERKMKADESINAREQGLYMIF